VIVTDKESLKEIARQEMRLAAANCGSSYAKATEDRARAAGGGSWFVGSWWLVASGVGAARRKKKP